MITWQERKAQKEALENVKKDFWAIVDPQNKGDIHGSPFIDALQKLCNASDAFALAGRHLDVYAEKDEQDKKELQELEDELLTAELDYYSAFVTFATKYGSESSRVHSAMGAVKSEKKANSSRENGKKGGRPRKNTEVQK